MASNNEDGLIGQNVSKQGFSISGSQFGIPGEEAGGKIPTQAAPMAGLMLPQRRAQAGQVPPVVASLVLKATAALPYHPMMICSMLRRFDASCV